MREETGHNSAARITAPVAIQQLMHSPRLPVYVQELRSRMQAEQERRERFYEEMSEQQKAMSAIFAGAERFVGNSLEH